MSRETGKLAVSDPIMVGALLALVGVGAIMVGSSSVSIANDRFGEPLYFLIQHFAALGLGLVAMLVAMQIPIEWWNRLASLVLLGAFTLLVMVLLPGVSDPANGARRWIDLGPLNLQASELARLLLLVYIASYCVRRHDALCSGFAGFARPLLVVAMASALLLLEPDFGATVVLTATSLGILFVAGARLRDVALTASAAGALFVLLIWASPYRFNRVLYSFLDPWEHRFDSGYQLVNSFIAIGSGTWFGAGLGEGVQKLHYLPEPHTDFVFAVLAEELGFIGASAVILLFALLVWRAFVLGQRAINRSKPFHGLLAIGIGLMLGMQAAISIGVNTGLLPTKGLTLPLISYGRTSVVVSLLAVGLLLRIAHELNQMPATEAERRAR